jgi:hypothetical protein
MIRSLPPGSACGNIRLDLAVKLLFQLLFERTRQQPSLHSQAAQAPGGETCDEGYE